MIFLLLHFIQKIVKAERKSEQISALIAVQICGKGVKKMNDLISRQAATTIPVMPKEHRHYQTNNLDDAYEQGWADLQECIGNLPTVQPNHNAEVSKMGIVHCENCEHWDTSWDTAYGLHYCPMIDMATKKNFFCKYGAEKRGDTE